MSIRKSFSRAISKEKDFYLQKYLTFLLPHLKVSKAKTDKYVHKPHVPLRLSPVLVVTSSDDDDEDKDVQVDSTKSTESFWVPQLDFYGKNDGLAYENYVHQDNGTQSQEYNEEASTSNNQKHDSNNIQHAISQEAESTAEATTSSDVHGSENMWNWICETQFINDLEADFANITPENQLLCTSDIFQAIYYHTYIQK